MSAADDGFRWMRVIDSQRIAPRMQRLRLAGGDLHRFDTDANLHVRLHVPVSQEAKLMRSAPAGDGRSLEVPAFAAVATRYYTIRRIDAAAGWVDIDFVLHETPGPAGDFARLAGIGDVCGMSGPCGLGVKPARHYLLAGDETALPAIARIAETLPGTATGEIMLEVDGPEDRLPLTIPEGMACRWFFRRGAAMPSEQRFIAEVTNAVRAIAAGPDHFVWIAAEFAAYEALRTPLKAIAKPRSINVPYWRAG